MIVISGTQTHRTSLHPRIGDDEFYCLVCRWGTTCSLAGPSLEPGSSSRPRRPALVESAELPETEAPRSRFKGLLERSPMTQTPDPRQD